MLGVERRLQSLSGQEHGRTIPLAEVQCASQQSRMIACASSSHWLLCDNLPSGLLPVPRDRLGVLSGSGMFVSSVDALLREAKK
jgi:hypothetical protein